MTRPNIAVGGWALPPLMVYGTEEQQQRWIPPTLRGEIEWCQLFSEPGAGSDLASLATRAERVEGGWLVSGQKVWTSMAERADWGILLARTDPEVAKHEGISFFMLDMKTPGIDVRPLRELAGFAMFNEVFLDEVFVPEDCLVGREHDGWRATRTSLANERVSMGSGATHRVRHPRDPRHRAFEGGGAGHAVLADVGELVAHGYTLAVLGFRLTLSALTGADPSGSEASVKKLLGVEHDQKVQEVGLGLLAGEGAAGRRRRRVVGAAVPVHPLPDHCRRHERDPAQHHRRARPRPAQGSLIPAVAAGQLVDTRNRSRTPGVEPRRVDRA